MKLKIENINKILAMLPENVTTVQADYNGSGDSGELNTLDFFDEGKQKVKVENAVTERVENLLETQLNRLHAGWENNDGASGSFHLDVKTRKLTNTHTEYYTESKTNTAEFEL